MRLIIPLAAIGAAFVYARTDGQGTAATVLIAAIFFYTLINLALMKD